MRKTTIPIVVFDTSVILSGLSSQSGGSHKLLALTKQRTIIGVVSVTIIKEALTHAQKLHLTPETIAQHSKTIFTSILPAPPPEVAREYASLLSDPDDAHLLATAKESGATYLVTLDRRHLLKEANKIKLVTIVSPKQLLEHLRKH